jgi:hypothetical protein
MAGANPIVATKVISRTALCGFNSVGRAYAERLRRKARPACNESGLLNPTNQYQAKKKIKGSLKKMVGGRMLQPAAEKLL